MATDLSKGFKTAKTFRSADAPPPTPYGSSFITPTKVEESEGPTRGNVRQRDRLKTAIPSRLGIRKRKWR